MSLSTQLPAGPADSQPNALAIEALREQHRVAPLTPEQEGFAAHQLPAGVYGFAYAPGQSEVPLFAKKSYHSFELHKAADGNDYLIGYVTPQEAADLDARKEGVNIALYPDPWEESQRLVNVPVSIMTPAKRAITREAGNPLRFTIT